MSSNDRRQHTRFKVPNGTLAAWKAPEQSSVSRVQNIGSGGINLITPKPPAAGSTVDLTVSLPIGELRARAVVIRSMPGKGMSLQFIQMSPEDRANLHQFLLQVAGGPSSVSPAGAPQQQVENLDQSATADRVFERELLALAESTRRHNYYQLLGVTHDSPVAEIKRQYHELAKKFHPDLHMEKRRVSGTLKDLMGKFTEAYQTLKDENKRNAYDQKLATIGAFTLDRSNTRSQETIDECVSRAQECLRAKNFVGSIAWLRKCVILMPYSSKYHVMLARSLASVIAYRDEAKSNFEKAIDLDPWNADAYFYFGNLYEALQLPWRAHALYAKVLEINPEHAGALDKLSLANLKTKA